MILYRAKGRKREKAFQDFLCRHKNKFMFGTNITSTIFCWSKQVTSPAQIQEEGQYTSPLDERSCEVTLPGVYIQVGEWLLLSFANIPLQVAMLVPS